MKLSLDWLNDYIDLSGLSAEEVAESITLATAEVEEVIEIAKELETVVVGEVLVVERVPETKLHKTTVEVGEAEPLQIVCGAPNVKKGMKVAVAKIDTILPGTSTPIKHVKLRKIDSYGMICSEVELGLGEESDGIMSLDSDLKIGTPITEVFGLRDTVFEVENKTITHRPDLWGHYGFARELACVHNLKLKPLYKKSELKEIQELKNKVSLKIKLEEPELCPRYCAMVLTNCKVKPSPQKMQNRLRAVGVRPINNIVDITNYVMLDIGQPLHAFDRTLVKDDEIIIRKAKSEETFTTLDDKKRELDESMLLIADKRGGIALAGIMGGLNSEISEKTKEVILESANFNPINVRKTSSKLGLRTESSMRFEKSLDPENAVLGVLLSYRHFKEQGLEPLTSMIDSGYKSEKITIPISCEFINRRLGTALEESEITRILKALEFDLKKKKEGTYEVTVPSFRATKDVSIPEDLVEEIGRIFGFNNIVEQFPAIRCKHHKPESWREIAQPLQRALSIGLGYHEVSNYSFCEKVVSQKLLGASVFEQWEKDEKFVHIKNPLGIENDRLRIDLLPGLMKNVLHNINRYHTMGLYELGRTYHPTIDEEGLITEILHLSGVKIAKEEGKDAKPLFLKVKGELNVALSRAGFNEVVYAPIATSPFPYYHSKRSTEIRINDICVGHLFQLKPKIILDLEIPGSLVAFDLEIPKLLQAQKEQEIKIFQPLPEYPPNIVDLAILVPETTAMATVRDKIFSCNSKGWLQAVELFDIYRNENKYPGQKSLAYTLEYRSDKGSLSSKQVEKEMQKAIKVLEKEGWQLRA